MQHVLSDAELHMKWTMVSIPCDKKNKNLKSTWQDGYHYKAKGFFM